MKDLLETLRYRLSEVHRLCNEEGHSQEQINFDCYATMETLENCVIDLDERLNKVEKQLKTLKIIDVLKKEEVL